MKKYAIVDIETTGGLHNRDKITEIAVIVTDGVRVVKEFQSLIHPERTIPHSITRITGITDDMVKDAPKFYEIARDLIEITEGCIFVAHNVKFDYSFIKKEFASLGFPYNKKSLCTVKLTRSQLPGLKSYGLDNLIRHFGLTVTQRHRAYGDAFATYEIFALLMKETTDDYHVRRMINHGIDESILPGGISIEQMHGASEGPGVYYLSDLQDRVLYIGKAKNIKKRLFQHFRQHSRKSINIYNHVEKLHFKETGNELIALLLELHEIKTIKPEFNKALRRTNFPYALYFHKNAGENQAIFIVGKHNNKNDDKYEKVKLFGSKASADSTVQGLITEEEICKKHFKSRSRDFSCACLGACNSFFEDRHGLISGLKETLKDEFEEDFVIVMNGRDAVERSFVMVYERRFYGFGYIPIDEAITSFESWSDYLSKRFFYPEANGLIRNYLIKNECTVIKIDQ